MKVLYKAQCSAKCCEKLGLSYAKLETKLSSGQENHFDLKAVTASVKNLGIIGIVILRSNRVTVGLTIMLMKHSAAPLNSQRNYLFHLPKKI